MVDVKMEPSWKEMLKDELAAPYFERLTNAVKLEYKTNRCFPEGRNIFRAFDLCPFNDVKVVILGQDPYHGPNQAHGLAFSVKPEIRPLENIKRPSEKVFRRPLFIVN